MAFYKVLKSGHFSEERFNKVGAIVEIDENAAKVAEERGFLQITTEKPKSAKPVKGTDPSRTEKKDVPPTTQPKPKAKAKAKAKPKKKK